MNRISIFICFCCVLASCKPNEPEPPPKDLGFLPLHEEVRAMIAFKPGTWWVYKNTLTNELDTVIVEQLQMDTVFRSGTKFKVWLEDPVLYLKRVSKGGYVELDNPNYYPSTSEFSLFYTFWTSRYEPGAFRGPASIYFWPYALNAVGTGGNTTYYNGQVSDTIIEGQNYPILQKFLIDNDDVFPVSSQFTRTGGPSIYYWARNIGIVRIWHFAHTTTNIPVYQAWNLVDYHIVQ